VIEKIQMKIAVNTRLLLKNKMEGVGWFAYETLKRITRQHPEHQFYFIFDRPFNSEFIFANNITPIVIGPPSRHPLLWYIWFNWSIAVVLKKIKPDLFFSPEGYLCLNTKVKSVNVIHDIAYEHYPDTVPYLVRMYYKYYFPKFAKKADRILTVSEFSKQDIVKNYKAVPGKIDVVYNGCNESYGPVPEAEKQTAREKYANSRSYFVYLGGINPRKNIKNLLLAFDQFKKHDTQETKLLLIGKKGFGSDALETLKETLETRNDIIFLGRIEDVHEVNRIISGSVALTYVSVFEGFGIPCLEAMRCATAVITSATSSMPEVCGESALYVDPLSVDSIADAMSRIINNPALRNNLIAEGYKRSYKFNWQTTSDLLWAAMKDVASK
jgi:glycosyltransferase involved in cell wall biosynthesis